MLLADYDDNDDGDKKYYMLYLREEQYIPKNLIHFPFKLS